MQYLNDKNRQKIINNKKRINNDNFQIKIKMIKNNIIVILS